MSSSRTAENHTIDDGCCKEWAGCSPSAARHLVVAGHARDPLLPSFRLRVRPSRAAEEWVWVLPPRARCVAAAHGRCASSGHTHGQCTAVIAFAHRARHVLPHVASPSGRTSSRTPAVPSHSATNAPNLTWRVARSAKDAAAGEWRDDRIAIVGRHRQAQVRGHR